MTICNKQVMAEKYHLLVVFGEKELLCVFNVKDYSNITQVLELCNLDTTK